MALRGNILVIDDDDSMRVGCAQTLTQGGFRVQAVEDGQRGLEASRQELKKGLFYEILAPLGPAP